MNNDRSNQVATWLQIASNAGVLIGLIFVGLQIMQDRELKIAELITIAANTDHDRQIALMGEEPAEAIAKLIDGQCLDLREQLIMEIYYDARIETWVRNSKLERLGLFSPSWRQDLDLSEKPWQNMIARNAFAADVDNPELVDGVRELFANYLSSTPEEELQQVVACDAEGDTTVSP